MIRVVIADDQALVRGGFRVLVNAAEDMEVPRRRPTAPKPCPLPVSTTLTWSSWTSGCQSSTASRPPGL